MAEYTSWAWLGTGTWPGFNLSNQSNVGDNGNGIVIDPGSHTSIVWVDSDGEDRSADNDTDDETVAGGDRVRIGGLDKIVHEIGAYSNTLITVNGSTYPVLMGVWVFTDGTYMMRTRDADLPPNQHHNKVTSIQLGTWDTVEYVGSWASTRVTPFTCFAAGTLIETPHGRLRVEALRAGDAVWTQDHGFQPVVAAGAKRVGAMGEAAPVCFDVGAIGNDRALLVSPRHRVLLSGWRCQALFGEDDVLCEARHLVNGTSIRRSPRAIVTYVHLVLEQHEILRSDGALSESMLVSDFSLHEPDRQSRHTQEQARPLRWGRVALPRQSARRCLRGFEARLMEEPVVQVPSTMVRAAALHA